MNSLIRLHLWHIVIGFIIILSIVYALAKYGDDAVEGIIWNDTDVQTSDVEWSSASFSLGVYDYQNTYGDVSGIAFEHQFYDWNSFSVEEYSNWVQLLKEKDRWPLITIEPFVSDNQSTGTLLSDITSGVYDSQIEAICNAVEQVGHPVFVRWGHEMERVTGRYPWATEDHEAYVSAYQYFVSNCTMYAPTTEMYLVWSPVGNDGLDLYYPGNDYVDYVGVSVYSFGEWEQDNYGDIRSFEENFGEKYERVKTYNKPVMIAEFGVDGTTAFKTEWIEDMINTGQLFPLLKTVVLFNAPDSPDAWGTQYSVPDWSLDPDTLGIE